MSFGSPGPSGPCSAAHAAPRLSPHRPPPRPHPAPRPPPRPCPPSSYSSSSPLLRFCDLFLLPPAPPPVRAPGSFLGGGLRGGGLRGGNLSRLGGSNHAGRQGFRAIDRAGLRHAEPLMCEPALAQVVPGFGLLSESHGEGTAAQGLELSSQAIGLFLVRHGYGFGGCHCRLGRRRLGALSHDLGVFAGEGRLAELFDR
jgi:hypothetical protein